MMLRFSIKKGDMRIKKNTLKEQTFYFWRILTLFYVKNENCGVRESVCCCTGIGEGVDIV